MGFNETELIARCRSGDPDAWDELFTLHYDAAARFVFQLGNDFTREDAEEICQEAFLAVIRNLSSFNGQLRKRRVLGVSARRLRFLTVRANR